MRLTIDNLDGLGAIDYSGAVCPEGPLTIERVLNAPSICGGILSAGTAASFGGHAAWLVPVRRGRTIVTSDAGTILFTGYLATEPEPVYAGSGTAGPVYRVAFSAISDEWLLDKQTVLLGGTGYAEPGGLLLETLTTRAGGLLTTGAVVEGRSVGVFEPELTTSWSGNAGSLAASTYAAYRVLDGALSLQPAGSVTHTLNFDEGAGDGTFDASTLKTTKVKELANDVTVSGAIEPTAYVTEMFAGDGTTAVFTLSEAPFRANGAAATSLLSDSFNESFLDTQLWAIADPGSHLGLSGAGLTMTGGNGFDGQTTLAAIDSFEMGGTLVLEAGNLQLSAGSVGMICGMYAGIIEAANCVAGYRVSQSAGTTVVTPFVSGVAVGTAYTALPGHLYTMRIRLHCCEMQRVLQSYYAMVDGVVEEFGGGLVSAPMSVVFELQDLGEASSSPATVLYDGSIATAPARCTFAAVNSVQLFGSIGFCRVTQTGSAWVVSTLPGGTPQTRLIGVAGEGVDCTLLAKGVVTFLAGRVPVAGELVSVFYRMRLRSVARLQDPASVATEAAGGMPGTARWLGKIVKPPARSSIDCESAAQAVLSFSSSRAAALAGRYLAVNPSADIWPGDVLAIPANGQVMSVVVRKVSIQDGHAVPEILNYATAFANDWAEGLGLTLSEAIAPDALLPVTPLNAPSMVLANLQALTVISASATTLQLDAGTDPPAGGGFEVRRRDGDFGPLVDQDLVLRSPIRGFSIPRAAQVEHYFVRMYDASVPPLYSRTSSAVFTNLPVA